MKITPVIGMEVYYNHTGIHKKVVSIDERVRFRDLRYPHRTSNAFHSEFSTSNYTLINRTPRQKIEAMLMK
jgi:hypothetical protein